ncbi:carboxyltransferase domain-containing protein [Paracoccus sp. Z330]|uniref:Carboxyltransferase domain-containing protein n=1 Tax=Paracoccus onchidii TaxID=3017813 RepID=A0ABT4ZCT2_9RHOB|nr:carboxyltransferase domain-containing protein [Paracoccus onchidii]MDB6177176.1 carboxyltransferase domain-containing protein [Paracoccus onchidii]
MSSDDSLSPGIFPAGPDALLVRFALTPCPAAMDAAQVLAARLDRDPPAGVTEIAPALVSVLLRFDRARTSRSALADTVLDQARAIAAQPPAPPAAVRRWTIPAAFGGENGPHLDDIANKLSITPKAAIARICGDDLRVLSIGFAPGQPYIGLLPEEWDLPRLTDMTPSVPAGAVVVAVRQIVMFGGASATGWRQIARSAFRTFLPDRSPPMPLRPGDAIRYVAAPESEIDMLARNSDGLGGAKLEVLA